MSKQSQHETRKGDGDFRKNLGKPKKRGAKKAGANPGGRPRRAEAPGVTVTFRASPAELASYSDAADAAGVTRSDWLRQVANREAGTDA